MGERALGQPTREGMKRGSLRKGVAGGYQAAPGPLVRRNNRESDASVSYTHLTLPTKRIV